MTRTRFPKLFNKLQLGATMRSYTAIVGASLGFTSMYLAAGALTPLLVVYRARWEVAPTLLTLAFAVYALGFLVASLTLGSLSDHIGRRPVLMIALTAQLLSNAIFFFAPDMDAVIVGRTIQGLASGAATAAFTALFVELAPQSRPNLAPILGSIGLTGGLALGSLLAGAAIQFTQDAVPIVFLSLSALSLFGLVSVWLAPETSRQRTPAWGSLVPRIRIPAVARLEFFTATPVITAVWMLAGLSGGLAPNMIHTVFHLDSGLLDGFAGFVAPAVAVVVGLSFARVPLRRAMGLGTVGSAVGALGILVGASSETLPLMLFGQAIAGASFGAAFTAALGLIIPLVDPAERAGTVAGMYVVSYVGLGLPVVLAGQVSDALGTVPAVAIYSCVVIVLSLVSLVAQHRLSGSTTDQTLI